MESTKRVRYSNMVHPQKVLRWAGIYGIGLGFLVASGVFTHKFGGEFFQNIEETGPLGIIWRNWHSVGCYCVGFMSYIASTWDHKKHKTQINDILRVNTFVFGTWSLMNLHLMLYKQEHVKKLLWLHVVSCGVAGFVSFSAIDSTEEEEN
eukprot:CAMPEP_0202687322 /NCGR_PEP_ID=MMETSP1385-20130828/3017_1 /ASSEMBLY_ACC=CAM_ASM_000861 /TAXON_ID=933848 /ORGANISM="Elphidium margaritaceum" /LENGTH=149 /DNA_ID=CAMNT_0049342091 /DNA_START=34 /DNA_END=483 /DNA_ORIENTATION=-